MKTIEVVAAVIHHGKKIYATQRGYGELAGSWEFPGGKIEPGETPEQALAREIHEELAADISIDEFICMVEQNHDDIHYKISCYLCLFNGTRPKLLEHSAAKWVGRKDIDSLDWLPADRKIVKILKERGII